MTRRRPNLFAPLVRWMGRRFDRTDRHLAELERGLCIYLETMMSLLDSIKTEVARDADLSAKILAKFNELSTNTVDPAEAAQVAAQLKASNDAKEAALNPPAA